MTSTPRLGYVILYVPNVPEAVRFYREAFGLEEKFLHESQQYAELDTGSTSLAFVSEEMLKGSYSFHPNRREEEAAGVEIALVVEDVASHYERAINAGALELQKPAEKPWGQVVSYVRDNNGFIVEICSSIGA